MSELGLSELGLSASEIALEEPARRDHGDLSSNVALTLAKQAQQPPRQLAETLVRQLNTVDIAHVDAVEVAGPGFINFRLSNSWWQSVVKHILQLGFDDYANLDFGQGAKVNLEFISANPTGPLHAGHARGAALGDSLAKILKRCGYEVWREFYVNDQGRQLKLFADSLSAAKSGLPVPEDGYKGDYVAEWAEELSPADQADNLRQWARDKALASQQKTLARLNISFDRWFNESELVGTSKVESLLGQLKAEGKAYEKDGATWLKVSDYGDTQDRVLVKSDGELTYLAPDIAYHADKLSRADRLINIWGADHHDYVTRLHAALAAIGQDSSRVEIITCQIVRLVRGGAEVKLSKRTGELISIDELIDEIGPDATKFAYLQQTSDTHLTIDLDVLRQKSMDNPVYYVQYAHVRACAILRQAGQLGFGAESEVASPESEGGSSSTQSEKARTQSEGATESFAGLAAGGSASLELLDHQRELEIMRLLGKFPDELRTACETRAPHRIVTWLKDLASAFHGFYHDCRVIDDEHPQELTRARLDLVDATRAGLAAGLDITGVSAPERM